MPPIRYHAADVNTSRRCHTKHTIPHENHTFNNVVPVISPTDTNTDADRGAQQESVSAPILLQVASQHGTRRTIGEIGQSGQLVKPIRVLKITG